MDIEIFVHGIMTDAKGSKSNIAAKFQNAPNTHCLPPIGVFWDIENCQVPKGKSAIALVQNIREKFFEHHREAEFMCVCDINKESKIVIQELILAQVTVVHISATSKNAADDKLRQCMRRFVDTHGAPSTLLLISDDVNFSSDLSDFRHRHNIRIILIHRGRAHQSLIACAHEHYEFSTVATDLPPRSPVKSMDKRPTTLVVTDLPTNRSIAQIKTMLKKLSQNCGGKVSDVRGGKAYVKFATPDAAERAQKRMDKEIIYGCEISVNFCHTVTECDFSSPCKISNKAFNSSNEASGASSSSRDSSASPPRETEGSKAYLTSSSSKTFEFPPPPILDNQTIPSLLKNNISFKEIQSQKSTKGSDSFLTPLNMEITKDNKCFQLDWNPNKVLNHASSKTSDISAFSPFKSESDSRAKYSQKNVGRVSPFIMQDSDKNGRNTHSDLGSIRRASSQVINTSNSYLFSNHGYPNSLQNVNSSFEIQPISDPFFYSPSWNGTSAVSDSALSVTRNNPITSLDSSSYVELHVSNLDPGFDVNDMKKILLSVFREHVMVLHISMCLQPDGSAKATVKVPTLQDAQFAISRLHRKKIGHKRILISHVSSDKTPPFYILKSETIALLNDIPNKSLPLIKFRELYEKRYHRPIAVSELYKMREAVTIQGDSGSRVVYLNSEYCNTPSLPDSEDSQECISVERPYCEVHFHVSASQGWAEQYNICPLPLVHISLKILATGVHRLLDSHQGSLPLISFCDCYEAEIGPLPIVGNFISSKEDPLEISLSVSQTSVVKEQKGVPLEHLIACIAGVEVAKSVFCIKKVQWLENKTDTQATQNFSPALMGQLTLFGREVMDLLKSQPQCLVQFNKFIPTYHHHFGRQCRVADYGFTKLIDLLEAIPHIVQVLGEGQNRQVTLTHRTQVKRFAAELLRILKSRASKQIAISEFPQAYEQVIEKTFEITNYGVCEIEDMLDEVPENVIVTSGSGSETIISIPKREQTLEEIERTKQFAEEVVELMKHTPNCSMTFNKFIPSYHHHFAKQCRVADYGFTKLIELFEAIPSVLEVKGTGDDKILQLVESEQHKILADRLIAVIKAQPTEMVDVTQLCGAYAQVHGHALRPSDFGFPNLEALLERLHEHFKVIFRSRRSYACLVDHDLVRQLSFNVRRLLMEQTDGTLPIKDVCHMYQTRFGPNTDLVFYFKDMSDVIKVTGGRLQLTPLHLLARDIIILLQENAGQVSLCVLGDLFQKRFGVPICAANYNFKSLHLLLEYLSDYFTLKGKRQKRIVCLNRETAGYPLSPKAVLSVSSLKEQNSIDILNEPVPSCVPSPSIKPHVKERLEDLMGFETPPITDVFCVAQPCFEYKSPRENIIAAIPNVIRTSITPAVVTSSDTLSLSYQKCSSVTTLTYSVPSLEISTNLSMQLPQSSSSKHQGAPPDLQQNIERPIFSVINVSKLCMSEKKQEVVHVNLNTANSLENHRGCEQLENFVSSPNSGSNICKNSISQTFEDLTKYNNESPGTKDGISSSKSTPTNDGRQQSRRNRIAAQFSSPING